MSQLLRAAVLGVVLLGCWHAAHAVEQPFYSFEGPLYLDVTCPPSDGYEWKPKKRHAAAYTYWIVPKDDRAVIGDATARTYWVGSVAIIYARVPKDVASEGLFQHEACHALGWDHGEDPIGGALWR